MSWQDPSLVLEFMTAQIERWICRTLWVCCPVSGARRIAVNHNLGKLFKVPL